MRQERLAAEWELARARRERSERNIVVTKGKKKP